MYCLKSTISIIPYYFRIPMGGNWNQTLCTRRRCYNDIVYDLNGYEGTGRYKREPSIYVWRNRLLLINIQFSIVEIFVRRSSHAGYIIIFIQILCRTGLHWWLLLLFTIDYTWLRRAACRYLHKLLWTKENIDKSHKGY